MAQIGCDYSFARPSPSVLAQYFSFVVRYIASNTSKAISAAEAASLHAAGLTIAFVFEDFADPLANNPGLSDFNGGVADANFAIAKMNALGVPADRPIYVAVDTGPNTSLFPRWASYFSGFSSIAGTRTAFYGGYILWSYLVDQGAINQFSLFWEAAAYSWSNYIVPAPGAVMIQQLSSPVAGTDQNTAYVKDFGQWPAPAAGPPPGGGTNTANTAVSSSFVQSYDQSLITPTESHDQVIYSVITTDATLATGAHTGFYLIPTPINQKAYPIGIFSYDGGATYNDFGYRLPIVTTYASVPPGVTIQPLVDASGNIVFDGVNNTGSSISLIIKIALLASYNPGPASTPLVIGANTAYTNVEPSLSADPYQPLLPPYSSYRRIASDTVSGTGDPTVAHGQSGVPNILFWVDTGLYATINPVGWASNGPLGVLGIHMDASNVRFHVDAGTYANCYYRVYKDN